MHTLFLAALTVAIAPVQSSLPNRQPQLAATRGLTALVFGSGQSIWFSASHDEGEHFSRAVQVTQVPLLALGRHRGPRVSISGSTLVVTAVVGKTAATGPHAHGLSQDGNLLAWRSTDEGRSWSEPVVINGAPGSAREGLHAVAASQGGELAAVWLDLRQGGTKLYGAFSADNGVSWSKNVLLYESTSGTICQCCDPSVVFTGPHHVAVMFRDVLDGARDMQLLTWQFNGKISGATKLGTGSWRINACPMDGGGLAHSGHKTVTAWRRDDTVFLDEPGQPEIALGKGQDVSLALTRRGPYVIWTAPSGVELWGSREGQSSILCPSGKLPTMIALPDGTGLAAWEDNGSIDVDRVP
jgi:hypothetical protein